MATDKSINSRAVEQAGISFGTIAELADTIHQLCIEVIAKIGVPDENPAHLAVAARDLASQVGLLADMGADSLGQLTLKGADPQQWLQPPVYHWVAQKEASHG